MKNSAQEIRRLQETAATLAQEKAKSDALFASIGDGAIATDERGRIVRINQAALKLLGFTKKDLFKKWFPKVIVATNESGEPMPNIDRPITQAMLEGRSINTRSYYIKKDGSLIPVFISVSPVLLNGKPVGAIEVFRDITKEIEVDRIKSEFISIASHQLRTPATAVKNFLWMLMEGFGGKLTKDQKELAQIAYDSNERQIAIVNDLLNVAQTEAGTFILHREAVDLCKFIKEVLEEQVGVIKDRSQELSLNLPDEEILVFVDRSYFRMVIDNLVSNATKYTPPGGKITISVQSTDKYAEISVKDTGVGIPAKERSKLFKKFTRIDNTLSADVGGTGIGLYLLKQILDLHGGKITVRSRVGAGSEFIVRLVAGIPEIKQTQRKKRDL